MAAIGLLARDVRATSADLWLLATAADVPGLALRCPGAIAGPINWVPAPGSIADLRIGRAVLSNLVPDTTYRTEAVLNGQSAAGSTVRTLPASLKSIETPLQLVLASCYCRLRGESRRAKDLFSDIERVMGTPHLTIWCGDQVYLDSPWDEYMLKWPHDPATLLTNHTLHYLRTWSDDHLGVPMAIGANVFTPDDHEYWNNAPYVNAVVPELAVSARRTNWLAVAKQLFDAFQGLPANQVDVDPISILLLDTRSDRSPNQKSFLPGSEVTRLRNWITQLKGPGFLVIGQPVFAAGGRSWWKPGMLEDYELPDFEQYPEFLRVLSLATHDLVILTGDVHYSRVSTLTRTNGRRLIEVISSPLALVKGLNEAKWMPPPDRLQGKGAGELSVMKVVHDERIQTNQAGVMTLSIWRHGSGAKLGIGYWPVSRAGGASGPAITAEEILLA